VSHSELIVIFRTHSEIEANVVAALLDSHGIETLRTSGPTPGLFQFKVTPLGETRISVREEDAAEAIRIIDSHREQVGGGMVVPLPQEFDALEARIGYRFRDRGMLEHALTHKSKAHEDPSGGVTDNESLEFLGDAILGLVVAEALFRSFPNYSEGQKSKIKANLVSTTALAEMAEQLGLGEHMILGRGEEKTGGRRKQALLADTCEALIAAIYLDGGIEQRGSSCRASLPRRSTRRASPNTSAAITSRGCRNGCRRSGGRCRRTALPGKSDPTIANCSTSKWWWAMMYWRRASAARRRTPNRTGPSSRWPRSRITK
jgi:Ribonuclease-III-like/Putative prokaryotic signal transducing protein